MTSANAIVWGLWAVAFLVLEGAALTRVTKWTTLSEFAWDVERALPVTRVVLLIGLAVLLSHIVSGYP